MVKHLVLGLVALMSLWAGSARAAEDDRPALPYVIIVGINQYNDPQIKPRKHAEADAKALYDLFTTKASLGADPDKVKLLLGSDDPKRPSQKATRENILKALEWVGKSAGKDDMVIFAYLGQGAPLGERSTYFALDSTFKDRAKDAIASGDIESYLDKLKSSRFVAFVDVNFLGFDAGKEKAPDPNLQNFYREFLGKDDEQKDELPSRVVFLPNSGLKPSLNLEKHGVFTQVLLDAFTGKADTEGYEPDGNIVISELSKYFKKELPNLVRQHGKTDEEKSQNPVVFDFQQNDFIVAYNPKVQPQARKRLDSFLKLAKEQGFPMDVVEEGQHLLYRMPKLEAHQNLRKAYQQLADSTFDLAKFQEERRAIYEKTTISQREASSFALTVMRAVKVVRQGYVKDVQQGDMVESAVRGMFKGLHEQMPSAIKEKVERAKTMKEMDLLKLLSDARMHLGKREDLASGKDVTLALDSMLGKLDRHTGYIDPETIYKMMMDTRGSFSGIGVQIRKNNIRDQLQVVTPILNSPAYKAKMFANDIITTIVREVDNDGNTLPKPEVLSTKGMTTEEAVKKILGKPGTKIKLLVEREGEEKPIEFNLIRGKVEVESVMGYKRNSDDSWNYVIDPENKICYVRLTQFSGNTQRDLEAAMRKLSAVGIKGFILDLRFNPGGLLDQAVKISDLFIDDGLIVTIRPRNGAETSYVGKSDGTYATFPMVCLVNGGSASASEIVSACLQDHARAIVIGSRSYGKGSVQTIHPFETGGQLKLTTATFWRPNGRNLNRASTNGKDEDEWGVSPNAGFDIKISTKEQNDLQDFQREQEIIHKPGYVAPKDKGEFQDRQLEKALEYLRAQIKTAGNTPVNGRPQASN